MLSTSPHRTCEPNQQSNAVYLVVNPMGRLLLSTSLVELVGGGVNNDALHATNSTQQSDDDSTEDAEP